MYVNLSIHCTTLKIMNRINAQIQKRKKVLKTKSKLIFKNFQEKFKHIFKINISRGGHIIHVAPRAT